MSYIDDFRARGLLQDVSDETELAKLATGTTFYVGFDPTALSLQIGNLIPLMVSMNLAKLGFKPLILFGGATGAIGDPSGRNTERQLIERDAIERNIAAQVSTVRQIFGRVGVDFEVVNNYDWTKDLSILDFLRDTGKHFTVNYMLAKDVIKNRLDGDGISYTEFSYMLLQALDFLTLYQRKKCVLQIGGSDQWGNLTAGLELIRKKIQGTAFAFSWPLLTDAQGKKFGKSEGHTLWLDPAMTSPYKFHQYWLNVEDADLAKLFKVFTFMPISEIEAKVKVWATAPEKREGQQLLADTICTLVHGTEATQAAKQAAKVLFGGSFAGLSESQLGEIFKDAPSASLPRDQVLAGSVLDLFVSAGAVKSKGEARRLITSGGAYLNNERVEQADNKISDGPIAERSIIVLRTGKKSYHLVRLV